MLTEKRILLHFVIFYILVLIYIIFVSGPFTGVFISADRSNDYLGVIALVFAVVSGHWKLILESIRPDNKRVKSIMTVFLLFLVVYILPNVAIYGVVPLTKFRWDVLEVAIVEEIVFRSLMFGMVLQIFKVELAQLPVHGFQIHISKKTFLSRVAFLFISISIVFSMFHFWDIYYGIQKGLLWERFIDRFSKGLILYCIPYFLSGKNIYISVYLHYINNIYAN